jgi:hypothetical protein
MNWKVENEIHGNLKPQWMYQMMVARYKGIIIAMNQLDA